MKIHVRGLRAAGAETPAAEPEEKEDEAESAFLEVMALAAEPLPPLEPGDLDRYHPGR